MNFSIEIGPHADLETLPPVKDIYVTMLPGGDYLETAQKAGDLAKKGFNPVPHFPARSMHNEKELKDYAPKSVDTAKYSEITVPALSSIFEGASEYNIPLAD